MSNEMIEGKQITRLTQDYDGKLNLLFCMSEL